MDILKSKLVSDLLNEGKLPAVVIDTQSLLKLGAIMLMVLLISTMFFRISGKIFN